MPSQNSISSQSIKRKIGQNLLSQIDNLHGSDQQLLTHNKFQVLTKLQILLRSEKREQPLDFKKISQQICLMAEKNLTTRGYSVLAYILIRNKLARMEDIQNWIKICCQGKE